MYSYCHKTSKAIEIVESIEVTAQTWWGSGNTLMGKQRCQICKG